MVAARTLPEWLNWGETVVIVGESTERHLHNNSLEARQTLGSEISFLPLKPGDYFYFSGGKNLLAFALGINI